jgi:hypothetical protein
MFRNTNLVTFVKKMMKSKNSLRILGFLLFTLGVLSFVFQLIGINFSFLQWIDAAGRLPGLLIRIVMITMGLLLVYATNFNYEEE